MSSLVLELQQEAMDPRTGVRDLLRKASVVATKLNIEELQDWVERELHGYKTSDQIPEYRSLNGQVKVYNPYHGWQPLIFANPEVARAFSQTDNRQPIGELENLLENADSNSTFQIPFPPEVLKRWQNEEFMQLGLVPTLIVSKSHIYGIVEAVRNLILQWSLKLEKDGILGEGLTFSQEEKQKASTTTYNIQNLQGVAGNVPAEYLQIGDYNTIHAELKRLGVPQDQRNELENILDALKTAKPEERKPLLHRGTEWLMKNAPSIGTLSTTIHTWFKFFQ
jgi:hypothetical protein